MHQAKLVINLVVDAVMHRLNARFRDNEGLPVACDW